ncbi:conserved hypothetical protein [Coccidioides posadasii str. Silveira]|uniref:Uncharacterized protein n=1 Tax=Coccidioides posadasii (strain RMSCC 757 / Silveira) TaxID=443226 RepID=E9DJI8_COCPS|nr:conserved hypothetical protein [Coccidioides posadasii str. Silveira]
MLFVLDDHSYCLPRHSFLHQVELCCSKRETKGVIRFANKSLSFGRHRAMNHVLSTLQAPIIPQVSYPAARQHQVAVMSNFLFVFKNMIFVGSHKRNWHNFSGRCAGTLSRMESLGHRDLNPAGWRRCKSCLSAGPIHHLKNTPEKASFYVPKGSLDPLIEFETEFRPPAPFQSRVRGPILGILRGDMQ